MQFTSHFLDIIHYKQICLSKNFYLVFKTSRFLKCILIFFFFELCRKCASHSIYDQSTPDIHTWTCHIYLACVRVGHCVTDGTVCCQILRYLRPGGTYRRDYSVTCCSRCGHCISVGCCAVLCWQMLVGRCCELWPCPWSWVRLCKWVGCGCESVFLRAHLTRAGTLLCNRCFPLMISYKM